MPFADIVKAKHCSWRGFFLASSESLWYWSDILAKHRNVCLCLPVSIQQGTAVGCLIGMSAKLESWIGVVVRVV